jgi:phospholipase/carboxylesterase
MSEYIHPPYSGQKPDSIVLLLHGYGSNGQDLIGLAPYWSKELPNTVFVAPDAFTPGEMGFGFQWFTLGSWLPHHMLQAAETTANQLNAYIDDLLQRYQLDDSRLALVGFSQGTMMSLYVAPRRKKPIAGVLGYSGALLGGEALIGSEAAMKMPIHLVHGDIDPVVTVAAWHHATGTLKKAGYDVGGNVTPGLVHSIDERGLQDGLQFLQRVLNVKG